MNQVAKKKETALAVIDNSIFEQDAHDGMGNISSEDVALPFLKVLSQLSPELESVEGAKAGMVYNTVTGEVFDGTKGILVVPCHYERKYIEWTPRGQGSGAPVAVHPATSDIMSKTFRKPGDSKDYLENGNYIENSAQHYVLVLDEGGNSNPALIVMKATQLKKSRKWNSMMMTLKMTGKNGPFTPPSYSHVYRLTTSKESNDKGTWYGWEVERVGPVEDAVVYATAKTFALSVAQGEVNVKHDQDEGAKAGSNIPF
jgi:hypothetical protein